MEKGVKKKERLNDRFFNRFWKHCQVYERKRKKICDSQTDISVKLNPD